MEFREVHEARAYILKLFGMTEDEMYTRFYLDARKPHPLILGDTAARRKFFTSFFRLDKLSEMQKMVRSALTEVGNAKVLLRELEGQVGALNVLPKEKVLELQRTLTDLQQSKAHYGRLVERAAKLNQLFEIKGSKLYKELYEELDGDFSQFKASQEKLAHRIQVTRRQLAAARKYSAYRVRLAEWKEEQQELAQYDVAEVDRKVARLQAYESQRLQSKNTLAEVTEKFTDARERARNSANRASQIREDLAKAREAVKGAETCPTCGGLMPSKHRKHAKQHVAELKEQLVQAEERQKKFGARASKYGLLLEECTTTAEVLEERIKKYTPYLRIQGRLKASAKPEPYEGEKYKEAEVEQKLDSLQEKESLFRSCEHLIDSFVEASALSKQEAGFATKQGMYQEKLLQVTEDIAKISFVLEEQQKLRKQRKELRERISDLQVQVEQEEAYRVLEQAFSNKGVKSVIIRSICQRLETTVNKYAKMLFPADFVFRFELDTQFNIVVERNFGSKKLVSDVRKLSGAESKLFSVLLLVALTTFVPPARRTSLLLLDEPTGALTAESSEAFCRFLPVLNKAIPHIVVITPRTEDVMNVEGARYFQVTRDKGVASIHQV
jgi:DNA repair exonuclease SbcCD ATPase subunit